MVKTAVIGNPVYAPRIRDMKGGQIAFVQGWAYNPKNNDLNDEFSITNKPQGTSDLLVRCISLGSYEIDLRTTKFRY